MMAWAMPTRWRKPLDSLPISLSRTSPREQRLDDLVGAAFDIGAGDAFELADEGEVLDDLHFGVKRRCFGEVADALLDLLRVLQHVEAGDGGFAGRGREEAREDAHRGGLTGAVGAEEADDLSFFHLEGDVVYGDSTGVSLG